MSGTAQGGRKSCLSDSKERYACSKRAFIRGVGLGGGGGVQGSFQGAVETILSLSSPLTDKCRRVVVIRRTEKGLRSTTATKSTMGIQRAKTPNSNVRSGHTHSNLQLAQLHALVCP